MKLFIITDIFGKTDHLDKIKNDISCGNEDVEIVDPYDNKKMSFENEDEAYALFVNRVGLEQYAELVYETVSSCRETGKIIVSFSIGASAVWAVSNRLTPGGIQKCICFYSSQIRNYLDTSPAIEIDVYFAKHEPRYDVSEISSFLSKKQNVNCFKTHYQHGFMNKYSCNYSEKGYNEYIQVIKNSITMSSGGQ